jgi:hypothetical protein
MDALDLVCARIQDGSYSPACESIVCASRATSVPWLLTFNKGRGGLEPGQGVSEMVTQWTRSNINPTDEDRRQDAAEVL